MLAQGSHMLVYDHFCLLPIASPKFLAVMGNLHACIFAFSSPVYNKQILVDFSQSRVAPLYSLAVVCERF